MEINILIYRNRNVRVLLLVKLRKRSMELKWVGESGRDASRVFNNCSYFWCFQNVHYRKIMLFLDDV